MDTLFLKIVNMSIAASWLILAVILLRLVLKKAPKWLHVLLWGIVAVGLICPFRFESAWSLVPSAETISPEIMMDWTPEISTGVNSIDNVVNPIITETFAPEPIASANPLQLLIPVLASIWVLGMVTMCLYAMISYIRLRRKIDASIPLQNTIWICDDIPTPFILGMIKPRIYIPSGTEESQLPHIIAHENAHLKRRDHWWKPLGFLVLAIHWFNPLVWVAYILLCRDIELACDEKVIRNLNQRESISYSEALLSCSVSRRTVMVCPLAFGEVGVKERVKRVLNYKKPGFWIVAVAVIAGIVTAVCFLTNPKQERFKIRIVVPAGSQEEFVYSDEEISPTGSKITFFSGAGLGDTEVVLKPIEAKEENAYEPTYLTPGMPVNMDVEKGAWFKIGINTQNPTDEDLVVYVEVEPVEVRVSETYAVRKWFDYLETPEEMQWDGCQEISLPEFPDVTFRWYPERLEAVTKEGTISLFQGMPIWNVYFYDLTGDGLPELCATCSFGSGIIDNRVIFYDYAKGIRYELSDRGHYDYALRASGRGNALLVEKTEYDTGKLVENGRPVFKDQCIQVEGFSNEAHSVFQAEVLEIHDGYYLVEPVEGSWELNSADRIEVPIRNAHPSPEPEVGDIIEIEYSGEISETYPARIEDVYGIRVIEESEQWDLIPMVMVDGTLYLDTGHESTVEARYGVMDGEITSQVDGGEKPTKDNQSNFGTGFGYQYGPTEGTIEIYMNEKWWVFATEEVRKEMPFSSTEYSPEGDLHLGLNAKIIEIDDLNSILYVRDIDKDAFVFGDRCAVDCSEAIKNHNLLYVNYDSEDNVKNIEFENFEIGDDIIIGLYDSEKQKALNGSAIAELIQLGTQRINQPENKFYLTIGADNVKSIELTMPGASGGCQNADGSLYQKGQRVWLEPLDGFTDLRGLTITAFGENGEVLWTASVPDTEENKGFTRLTNDDWTITNIE